MNNQNPNIYSHLMSQNDKLIQQLMGEGGQALLDREILQMRDQIGQEQFHQYALQFFKNTQIDYKQFFNIPQPTPTTKIQEKPQEQQMTQPTDEIQIDQNPPQKVKQEHPTQVQVIELPAEQQQHTNNSEQFQNQFEEIEKQEVGENKYRIKYRNGDMYEGEMQEGIKNGWGEYTYQSGQKYAGCFIDDQIHGYGRYYFLSGAQYEGDWSSGMKHGIGILKFGNKDIYQGQFAKDDLHGKGTYKYHNGDVFEGMFKGGKRQGSGTFTGADGRLQIGEWVNDKFQI